MKPVRDRFWLWMLWLIVAEGLLLALIVAIAGYEWSVIWPHLIVAALAYKALEYRRQWLNERAHNYWPEFKAKWDREHKQAKK